MTTKLDVRHTHTPPQAHALMHFLFHLFTYTKKRRNLRCNKEEEEKMSRILLILSYLATTILALIPKHHTNSLEPYLHRSSKSRSKIIKK